MKNNTGKKGNMKQRPLIPYWVLGVAALVLVALAGVWVATRGNGSSAVLPREISVADAYVKQSAGAFLLDVREPSEWEEVHIPGAILIPLAELEGRVNELPRDQEIVVVCRSGNRSQVGRDTLLQAGFTRVSSMAGGVTEWKAAGYSTVRGK